MPTLPLSQKSLLIFDLDGTLIDSVPDLATAVNLMLQDFGRDTFDESIVRYWVGNGAKVLVQRALSNSQSVFNASDKDLSPQLVNEALERFFVHYREHTCEKTQAYAGVSQGLSQLKAAGFTLAIATNKPNEFVPTILAKLGWQDLFTLVLGGDSLPVKKPDPAPLYVICEKLGFSPSQSYMIGDSKNDILAGKNAGMDTLGLSYGYNYGEDIREQQPTYAFDSFADLMAFLLP